MSQLFNMNKNQKEYKSLQISHKTFTHVLEKNILSYVQKYLKAFAPAIST